MAGIQAANALNQDFIDFDSSDEDLVLAADEQNNPRQYVSPGVFNIQRFIEHQVLDTVSIRKHHENAAARA